MNSIYSKYLLGLAVAFSLVGCSFFKNNKANTTILLNKTNSPIKIDGKLDEVAWGKAPAYQLASSKDFPKSIQKAMGNKLIEAGEFKLLYDDKYLYVGTKFTDSDIIAEGTKDQEHHYRKGDLAEVFIKPVCDVYYWECYVPPKGHKTAFFLPSRGRLFVPSCNNAAIPEMKVAATLEGTLNNWQDKDKCWYGEMAIPLASLTQYSKKTFDLMNWKIMVARYNYSKYLPYRENSTWPRLSQSSFHFEEEFGSIKFVKNCPQNNH